MNPVRNKKSNGVKLINVIPIAKGVFRENLSYFTSKDVRVGALVTIPIKKKVTPAIVVSTQDIVKVKTTLRRAEFSLKSLISIKSNQFFKPEFIEASKEIANYFLSPIGSVLKDFVPQAVLENNSIILDNKIKEDISNKTGWYEISLIAESKEERLKDYRRIVREEFAKNHSVFFCLPTTSEIEEIQSELKKGIEKYAVILHGNMPKKKISELWNFIVTEKHPLLIIATRIFLSLPRQDIKTFIIDCENSPLYKLQTRPYIDVRKAAEIIGSNSKARIIFGDIFLRTEIYYENKAISAQRITSESENTIIELKPPQVIGEELQKVIKDAQEKNEKMLLFINRRGHSPLTLCNDCQHTLFCAKCESPLILHKEELENKKVKFICHKCLYKVTVPEQCPFCGSWRLETFGIGIQKTIEEIKKIFPQLKLFRMDSDTIKTKKQGDDIAKKFLETSGGVLVGTEILFSYINKKVDKVAVVSIDALFTLPDFRINEKIFQLLLKLRSLAKKTFVIQTRMSEKDIFGNAIKGNVSRFYKAELEWRKKLEYPPFKILIKITKEDKNKIKLRKDIQSLEKKLEKWNPLSYSSFTPKIKNVYSWNILLKLNPESWPSQEDELYQILSSLPPAWKINVNPDSLL